MVISLKSSIDQVIYNKKTLGVLSKLKIKTINDFLFYFPKNYDDRRNLPSVCQLFKGDVHTFFGRVMSVKERRIIKGNRSVLEVTLKDSMEATIKAVWFNQAFLKKRLKKNMGVIVKGKVSFCSFSYHKTINVFEYECLFDQEDYGSFLGVIVPVYPLKSSLHQRTIRKIFKTYIPILIKYLSDPLSSDIRSKYQLMGLKEAIFLLHFPEEGVGFSEAKYRLIFDDFFYFQLFLDTTSGTSFSTKVFAPVLSAKGVLIEAYMRNLPYYLTSDQKKVIAEIRDDLASGYRMNRLLQGDVGVGKTDVAIYTLLTAIQSGYTAVFMAPTQVLAEQHYKKCVRLLSDLDMDILFLKGRQLKAERKMLLDMIQTKKRCLLIGTHALIQKSLDIPNLGLCVIDEQHRFGVMQRQWFYYNAGAHIHALFMTATPIPRTLALTCFSDFDHSIISEYPKGRKPIKTYFAKYESLSRVLDNIRLRIALGEQAYIVLPLVEKSERLALKSVVKEYESMKKVFHSFKVGMIHGKLSSLEKGSVMDAFRKNEIQVLLSTTVIEVGVDVPNATVMLIIHVERFGLSQLHQLRGRVGRGDKPSICFLVGNLKTLESRQRVHAMLETTDGFSIAEYDLLIRGPGDMLGLDQSGLPKFRLASLVKDGAILLKAREAIKWIFKQDPYLEWKEHKHLKKLLLSASEKQLQTLN